MSDESHIRSGINPGDPSAADELLPLVYDELRRLAAAKLAHEKPGQTLQATALVHEAYLRLVGHGQDANFTGKSHFFSAAAEAMRRLLIERARKRKSVRHGGEWQRVELEERDMACFSEPDEVIALDRALARLETQDCEAAELVKLCVFAGLSVEKAGTLLNMSRATAYRNWAYARAMLKAEMDSNEGI